LKKRGRVLKKQGKAGEATGAGKSSLKQLNSRVPVVLQVVQEAGLNNVVKSNVKSRKKLPETFCSKA